MRVDVKTDFKGATKKTKALKNIPRATRFQLNTWGGQFVQYLKQTSTKGRYIGKYRGGRRTGQLARGIRKKVSTIGNMYKLEVGTSGVKYARILEKGGTIRAKNKFIGKRKQSGPWLFIPIREGGKTTFRLKKSVKIPAFRWLEKSVRDRKGKLDSMLSKARLYRQAEKMK